jgi:uncharacterized membrane-anchored protein
VKQRLAVSAFVEIQLKGDSFMYLRFALRNAALAALFSALAVVPPCSLAQAQETEPQAEIAWQEGPSTASIGGEAQINVPAGFVFAGPDDTRKLMELMQNPISGTELGFLAPQEEDWFIVFEFDSVGYIKDDEKDSLDAGAILSEIQRATEESNEERVRRGWAPFNVVGWEHMPQYDPATNNLEWAIRGESEGSFVINHNTRMLGRNGVMRVTLVSEPEKLPADLPKYREVMAGYSFTAGNRYAEYRAGDKLAQYGLSALVVGGAAAVATKTGLLKVIGKFGYVIILGGFAAVAGFMRLVGGRIKALFGRGSSTASE